MVSAELISIIEIVIRSFAFVALYFFVGFGSGFITGIMLANAVIGRNKPILFKTHKENISKAAQHNAQWNPSNERWRS